MQLQLNDNINYFPLCVQKNVQQEFDFGETLPPDWNKLDDVYALQYRRGNLSSVFIFKALKLGNKLMVYLMVSVYYFLFYERSQSLARYQKEKVFKLWWGV